MVFRTPFFLPWLYPSLVWRIHTKEKKIFLTFDDGPIPGPTEFVLETLEHFKAKATFFCIGHNVQKHPYVFAKIIKAGHSIGNHTHTHVKGWNVSTPEYLENTKMCAKALHQAGLTFRQPALFRPPYGRIKRQQISVLSSYRIVMWDVLTQDYLTTLNQNKCLTQSIAATRPGSIVVFHDSMKAEKNLSHVLPRYLEHFTKAGYSFEEL